MAVADEICTYLAAQGLGLSATSPANLFDRPFPPEAPDRAACVDVYSGRKSDRVFGDGKPSIVAEYPLFHVFTRDLRDNDAAAEALAEAIYYALEGIGPTISGVQYLDIRASDGPPKFAGIDGNLRSVYVVSFEATRRPS